jgi:short-subunit dehydrogenase
METDHDRLTVVITGASSGIGEATAEAFAREGARLVLAARGVEALEQVARHCRALGAEALVVPLDITDPHAVQALASRVREFASTVHMWISNVGVGAVGKYHEVPMDAHEQVVRANLLGHMYDAHVAVPIFLEQGFGTFVNMISIGGFAPAPYAAAYTASKFGLKGFSEALRGELSAYPDIHVCDVYPTFVDTPGIVHAGNYTGRRLSAPPPVEDARYVAKAIVGLSRRPRRTVLVGRTAPLIRLVSVLAPSLSARMMNRFLGRYFDRADPAPVTEGKLFAPPPSPDGIDGGVRERRD